MATEATTAEATTAETKASEIRPDGREAVVHEVRDPGRELGQQLVGLCLCDLAVGDGRVEVRLRIGDDCVDHVLRGLALADGEVGQRLSALERGADFGGGDAKRRCDGVEAFADEIAGATMAAEGPAVGAVSGPGGDDCRD